MGEISGGKEIAEVRNLESENYKDIKPEGHLTVEEARSFFDNIFGQFENTEEDNPEDDLDKVLQDYFKDLKDKSECPETIPDKPFEASDLKKRTPEENAEKREEFDDKKAQLKKEWEEANGRPWPKYDHDIYSASGKLIRKIEEHFPNHP